MAYGLGAAAICRASIPSSPRKIVSSEDSPSDVSRVSEPVDVFNGECESGLSDRRSSDSTNASLGPTSLTCEIRESFLQR
jgi:hypothetical protein